VRGFKGCTLLRATVMADNMMQVTTICQSGPVSSATAVVVNLRTLVGLLAFVISSRGATAAIPQKRQRLSISAVSAPPPAGTLKHLSVGAYLVEAHRPGPVATLLSTATSRLRREALAPSSRYFARPVPNLCTG
jgi:hypothetical protein